MGVVYRALDKWSGVPCAVKLLDGTTDARRFLREARILAQLSHPSIVRHIGHGVSPSGTLFLAMEWVEGSDLERELAARPFSIAETLALGRRLSEALGVVHGAGIVHRDLKPSNVFLPDGQVELAKLGDFGVAHLVDAAAREATSVLTRTGVIVGTLGYLAPEQLRGGSVDERTDLFGLGCILFECLTGRPAFWADSLPAMLAKIALDPTPRARDTRADLPKGLDALIARLLAREASARPASARAVFDAIVELEADSEGEPVSFAVPSLLGSAAFGTVLVVVCPGHASGGGILEGLPPKAYPELDSIAHGLDARLEHLPDGSFIAVLGAIEEPATEQALRAARLAGALGPALAGRPIAVLAARMSAAHAPSLSGEIERALSLVEGAARSAIVLDPTSAALLEAHFEVHFDGPLICLGRELASAHASAPVLGQNTRLVGREREFARVFDALEQCLGQSRAHVLWLIGAPGVGKSRLLTELLAAFDVRYKGTLRILLARGEPALDTQPLSLLGNALRRDAGIHCDDDTEQRLQKLAQFAARSGPHLAEVGAFLGEIMGLDLPDSTDARLPHVRSQPSAMRTEIRDAFVTWVRQVTATRALCIALDDAHHGDALSLELLACAQRALPDAPLFILGMQSSDEQFACTRWFGHDEVTELELGLLSQRASEELLWATLGPYMPAELVSSIVERAQGQPAFLVELIRLGASGGGFDLPDTPLGVVRARLARLEPEARQVLGAASILGMNSWPRATSSLLTHTGAGDVSEWLRTLAQREFLIATQTSQFGTETEYRFCNALTQSESYRTCSELDRQRGHALAASWLEAHGEGAAVLLASHWERAAEATRAGAAYVRAIEQALRYDEFAAALLLADRARRSGAPEGLLETVRSLENEAVTRHSGR